MDHESVSEKIVNITLFDAENEETYEIAVSADDAHRAMTGKLINKL